ncbi:hypothetical protein RYH80_15880 [Halobaculum sp. MBLA0147]|uniref:hypothetical protein n=1 Tax=Halobaculum sp. MBLA0147 TaxID=3079934 RepID=UPI0035243272
MPTIPSTLRLPRPDGLAVAIGLLCGLFVAWSLPRLPITWAETALLDLPIPPATTVWGVVAVTGLVGGAVWLLSEFVTGVVETVVRRRLTLPLVVVTGSGPIATAVLARIGGGPPVEDALGLLVVAAAGVVGSYGATRHARYRTETESCHDRVVVTTSNRWHLTVGGLVGVVGTAVVAVLWGWDLGLSMGVSVALSVAARSDPDGRCYALDSGVVLESSAGTAVHLPWRGLDGVDADGDRLQVGTLVPYPAVRRRVAPDAATASEFVDTVRRLRRRS